MSNNLAYLKAYCLELDAILPPDNARDAHASPINPDKSKDFHFFCEDESCGCKMKGNRIHRWDTRTGRAYYSLWPNSFHSDTCKYKDLNNKSSGGGSPTKIPTRQPLENNYPSWLLTKINEGQTPQYYFDFNQPLPPLDELLNKIKLAKEQNIDWANIPISDLRIIVESYVAMKTEEERRNHFLKIDDEKVKLRYANKFSAFKWLVSADYKYSHIYFGLIKNKIAKEEIINNVEYYTFYLDWNIEKNIPHKHKDYSYKILINKNNLNGTYFIEMFDQNILQRIKWENKYLYALDPKFIFLFDKRTIEIILNDPRHFVITDTL